MSCSIQDLKRHLSQDSIQPVYLLLGKEDFLQKESLRMIKDRIVTDEYKDFNYDVFYAKDISTKRLQESLEILPVLSSQRLVVCFDVHLLKEKDWTALLPFLKKPIPTSVLVLLADDLDKRKKFSKHIMGCSFVVQNDIPAQKDLPFWVKTLAVSCQLQLSPGAVQLLIRWAGPSIMNLSNEIKKIKSYIGSRTHVTEDDVIQVVSRVRPENVFAFTTAIGKKDIQKSFQFLIHLLEDQESETGLVALVARHLRILSRIKEGLKEGLRPSELSNKAGVPVFFLKDYIEQARIWDDGSIFKVTKILHDTDRALKSSPLSSDIWLENFVLKACM